MDKSIVGLITIGIVCYLIAIAGMVVIIAGVIICVIYLCILAYKAVTRKKNIEKIKRIFIEQLSQHIYDNNADLDEIISNLLADRISKYRVSQSVTLSFEEMRDKLKQVFENCSVKVYKHEIDFNVFVKFRSSELSRCSAKIKFDKIYKLSNLINIPNFSIQSKYWTLHALPAFCIFETEASIDIIEWKQIKITDLGAIYVSEEGFTSVIGADPAYYEYLHERVGGGPDRRYKNNPSTPVYRYGNIKLATPNISIFLSIANEDYVSEIITKFNDFLGILKSNRIDKYQDIANIDLSNDEVASVFRELVLINGSAIYGEKRFMSILSDYHVFKNSGFLKLILQYIGNNGYWSSILSPSCDVGTLNDIKDALIHTGQFKEEDVALTLAYIGHGLQILRT